VGRTGEAMDWHQGTGPCYARVSSAGGNNSVVECDLAKVEVAGSNPVSRSNFFPMLNLSDRSTRCPSTVAQDTPSIVEGCCRRCCS
jgi:hypothetical protein